MCDYQMCQQWWFTDDNQGREHYQNIHEEDLVPANGRHGEDWLRSTRIEKRWWRCSKCLTRAYTDEDGWQCRHCGCSCEDERISERHLRFGLSTVKSSSGPKRTLVNHFLEEYGLGSKRRDDGNRWTAGASSFARLAADNHRFENGEMLWMNDITNDTALYEHMIDETDQDVFFV